MPALPFLLSAEIAGYFASGLVFLTFCMRTLLPLRVMAILSNIAFIIYGAGAGLGPIMLLHSALLPLNIFRTFQNLRDMRNLKKAAQREASFEDMLPFMQRKNVSKGTVLYERGNPADCIYYIASGSVWKPETNTVSGEGEIIGETGIFTSDRKRTTSTLCKSDCILYVITNQDVQRLMLTNPSFGIFMVKLIVSRKTHSLRPPVLRGSLIDMIEPPQVQTHPSTGWSFRRAARAKVQKRKYGGTSPSKPDHIGTTAQA